MKKLIARQVKRLKNPLFLLLLAVAVGLGAYFLSGTQFFKGLLPVPEPEITDAEIATQDDEMVKVKKYVSVITDGKGANWPIQANKQAIFEVEDKGPVTFTSEKDYGTWRWLHSDFDMDEVLDGDGLMYQLTDQSTAQGTVIKQICPDFGDGSSANCYPTPINVAEYPYIAHTYEKAGTYNVTVKVKDAKGGSDSSSQTIEVEQKTPPAEPGFEEPEEPEEPEGGESFPIIVAEITAGCEVSSAGLTATFTDESTSTNPENVPVNEWTWNFGDGQTSAEQNPVHEYIAPDTYKATLEAKNKETGIKDFVDCLVIVAAPAPALTADFKIAPTTYSKHGINHFFYNKSNAAPLTKATWSFGGGTPTTSTLEGLNLVDMSNPKDEIFGDTSHVYPFPDGNGGSYETAYTVSLKVFDDTNSATATQDLIVKKPVKADFTCKWNSIVTPPIGLTATPSAPENGNIIIKVTDTSETEEGVEIADRNVLLQNNTLATPSFTDENTYLLGQNKYIKYIVYTSTSGLSDTKTVEDVTNSSDCTKDASLTISNTAEYTEKSRLYLLNDVLKVSPMPEVPSPLKEGGAAAAVMVSPDSVKAPAGSTVYFKANCLYGEKRVKIIPISAKSISAVLDIFENEAACPVEEAEVEEAEEEEAEEEEAEEEEAEEDDVKEDDVKEEDVKEDDKDDDKEDVEDDKEDVKDDKKEDDKDDVKKDVKDEPKTLGIPEITKPEKNEIFTNIPRTVNIAWTEVAKAETYDLELGCDWCESNTDKWKNPGKFESSKTTYTPTAPLPGDGEYRVRVRAKNTDLTGEWSNYTYFSFDTAPKYECNDGKDNDGDGYIDFGADAGCKTPEDPDEENPPARIVTACSDGIDNDADGYIDLADIGCEDANDVNEKNKTEPVATSVTFKQFCHDSVDPKDFADITEDDYEKVIRDIIKDEAATAYNADPFEGEPIFIGYPKSGDTVFKPDQAIRRDEVIKIVELATCLPEHLKALDEYSLEEVDFDDSEFDNPNYWGKNYLYLAKNADIIDKGDVAAKVSRAEFLKILLNIHAKVTGEDIESCKDKEIPFVDVKANGWYCPYAVKAYEIGIAEGLEDKYGNLRLSPNSILTRMDAAIWLRNYYVTITGSGFADTTGGPTKIKPIEKISR